MSQRLFYNLFATDGFIDLPIDPAGTKPRRRVYIFGFVGGAVQDSIDILRCADGPSYGGEHPV